MRAAVCVLVLLASWSTRASAQLNLIGPGQEQAVLELFAPHALGREIAGGFALWNVAIERDRVVVTVRASDGREGRITMLHPDDAPEHAARTASFAIVEEGEGGVARRALIEAVRRNDRGEFWPRARATISLSGGARDGPASAWRQQLFGAPGWVPLDGILVILIVYLLALVLAARLLWRAPRWAGAALAATVIAGALVRLALSPEAFLGAWPWSRTYPHIRAVTDGRWIDALTARLGEEAIWFDDAMFWTSFAYAVVMPLVAFSHATYLLRSPRAGLAAAFILAFLPQHIRFSRCEDGFVASLVLTSLAFALIHGWLRDRSRVVRWAWILALPLILYPGYLLRPLNILFAPVYAIAIVGLHRETAPLARRGAALAIVIAIGAIAALDLVSANAEPVSAATSSWSWMTGAVTVILSPRLLVLSDPTRTPPVFIAFVVLGAVLAWRSGAKKLVLFLIAWALLFVVMHAFVVQETMQPRYMLHIVVPCALLAACAVPRIARRHRRWLALAAIAMAASPWIHRGFIEDTDYAEMHEHRFVRRARALIPERCTVLEYTGGPKEVDELRFSRGGARVGSARGAKFRAIGVWADGSTSDGRTIDEVLSDPPSCLYLYEGLACSTFREGDETYASMCGVLYRRLDVEPVLEERVPARLYDHAVARDRPLTIEQIPLRLSRARITRAER